MPMYDADLICGLVVEDLCRVPAIKPPVSSENFLSEWTLERVSEMERYGVVRASPIGAPYFGAIEVAAPALQKYTTRCEMFSSIGG
jgi:hypothetical protein